MTRRSARQWTAAAGWRLCAPVDHRWQAWRRTEWPDTTAEHGRGRSALVVASYGTAQALSHLLFSIYRTLNIDERPRVVVVDNGSRDDSLEFLSAFAEAGLITLLRRSGRRPYHAPALNAGASFVAAQQADPSWAVEHLWVIDSDVIVLRRGAFSLAESRLRAGAVLAGQFRRRHPGMPHGYAHVSANVLRPEVAWRDPVPPFLETGSPGIPMQRALRDAGHEIADVPFYRDEWLLHVGHTTLTAVVAAGETRNRHYEWASAQPPSHYEGNPRGPALHRRAVEAFMDEVPRRAPGDLVDACLRSERVEVVLD